MTKPSLTALLMSDGKPGHYHQAEGVIAAIARLRPVKTLRLEVARRFVIPTRTLAQLLNLGVPPATVLGLGYGVPAGALPAADLVVSAGGETLAANAAAAQMLGVPNVFCGRLRRLQPALVRVVIVTLERLAAHPNHLVSLPPSPNDPTDRTLAAGGASPLGPANPPRRVGVLIGGDAGAFHYAAEDWAKLTVFLRSAHLTHGIRWLVTTSRRSGTPIADALRAMTSDSTAGIEQFIDFPTAGPGSLGKVFAAADAIVCTDDSTTMISETIGAGLPLVAVRPAACSLEPREAEYRDVLASRGWYRALPLARLTPQTFLQALGEIRPRTTSQLDELAAALKGRLPELLGAG